MILIPCKDHCYGLIYILRKQNVAQVLMTFESPTFNQSVKRKNIFSQPSKWVT